MANRQSHREGKTRHHKVTVGSHDRHVVQHELPTQRILHLNCCCTWTWLTTYLPKKVHICNDDFIAQTLPSMTGAPSRILMPATCETAALLYLHQDFWDSLSCKLTCCWRNRGTPPSWLTPSECNQPVQPLPGGTVSYYLLSRLLMHLGVIESDMEKSADRVNFRCFTLVLKTFSRVFLHWFFFLKKCVNACLNRIQEQREGVHCTL